jgi:hypothetical protein
MWPNLLRFLKRRIYEPKNWVITDAGRPLFRLEYLDSRDNWLEYRVVYLEGTAELWKYASDRATDPRQFGWMLEEVGGSGKVPLSYAMVLGTEDPHLAVVKFVGPP